MRSTLLVLALVGAFALAGAVSSARPSGGVLLATTCVTTPGHPARTLSPRYGSGIALGAGPVYPVVPLVHASVRFIPRGTWYLQKILWIVSPRDRHRVTITLAGSTRFATVTPFGPPRITGRTIRIGAGRGWRDSASEVAIRGPGCISVNASVGEAILIRAVIGRVP
jgi:hypothetical protein